MTSKLSDFFKKDIGKYKIIITLSPIAEPEDIPKPADTPLAAPQPDIALEPPKRVQKHNQKSKSLEVQKKTPFRLQIESDKRRTAGFHIYPEFKDAIAAIASFLGSGKKGQTLEFLVDYYLNKIPEKSRERFLDRMKQPNSWLDELL